MPIIYLGEKLKTLRNAYSKTPLKANHKCFFTKKNIDAYAY